MDTTVLLDGDKRAKSGSIWKLDKAPPIEGTLEF
jgi:hypothetical protein